MPPGTFTLERFCGTEVFLVSEAVFSYRIQETQMAVFLWAETEAEPLEYLPDTENLNGQPDAQWNLVLPFNDIHSLPGNTFRLPHDYDAVKQQYLTNFCYVEHDSILDSRIEILAQEDDGLRIRATGRVTDINYYDGSKPPTKITVEAVFTLVETFLSIKAN